MKLLTNNLLNSSKEPTMFGGILLNHTRAGPLRVVRKALHIILSRIPWRCIVVLKVAMCSHGSRVPSYESNKGILNLEGRGWLLMEVTKGESIQWTKSSTWLVLLIFSLRTLFYQKKTGESRQKMVRVCSHIAMLVLTRKSIQNWQVYSGKSFWCEMEQIQKKQMESKCLCLQRHIGQ